MKKLIAMATLAAMHACAWSASEILIGQTADFSSVAGVQMKDFNAGALAYIEKINAAGGVGGRRIKLISLDDAFSADKAAANAKELIDKHNVVALFATRGTDPTEAVIKVADAADVPLIAPITGVDTVRKSRIAFPVRAGYRAEIEGMLRQLSVIPTRLAVLVQDDKFGRPLIDLIEERVAAKYKNITVVKRVSFERKSTDLHTQASEILSVLPNAVIALCNPSSCESFTREIAAQSGPGKTHRPTLYQTSISDAYAQFDKLGPEAVAGHVYGQVLPDPARVRSAIGKEYLALVKSNKGRVDYRSFEGYVSAKLLVEALKRSKPVSPAGVQSALENMGTVDLGGYKVSYRPGDHDGSEFFDLVTMDRSGRPVR